MIVAIVMVLPVASAVPAAAQAPAISSAEDEVPEHTRAMRDALAAAEWVEAEAGFALMVAVAASGQTVTAIRLDPARFAFSIVPQAGPKGERVDAAGEREGAIVAINGGFFGEKDSGDLFPVGLLRLDGKDRSQAWASTGGIIVIEDGRPGLRASSAGLPDGAMNALQSKPMLIEPGGKWAMNTNLGQLRKRSILCLLPDGDVVLAVVTRVGVSLYEAGWLMRGEGEGGFFGCDAALALDGGGSTQLWLADRPDLSYRGETPVQNVLVARRRE